MSEDMQARALVLQLWATQVSMAVVGMEFMHMCWCEQMRV